MKNIYIIGLALLSIAFLYCFSALLLPFFIAAVLAYIFNPAVSKLKSYGVPRSISAFLITCIILAIVVIFFIYTSPFVYKQFMNLVSEIPAYIQRIQNLIVRSMDRLNEAVPAEYIQQIQHKVHLLSKEIINWSFVSTKSILNNSWTVLHVVMYIVIVPFITFYLLRDWHEVLKGILSHTAPRYKKLLVELATKIDHTLAGFARGQATVSLIMTFYYGITLHLIGLDFGGLVGALVGIFSFVPYLGSICGYLTTFIIAFFQSSPWMFGESGSWGFVGVITIIFAIGQSLEAGILNPYIIGRSIGLHPVWVIFALLFGGQVAGFWGILVATPVAGALGVVTRYFLAEYKKKIYRKRPKKIFKKIDSYDKQSNI